MAAQVALKRQQAAEDAIIMGLRACSPDGHYGYLPQGPIFGSRGETDVEDIDKDSVDGGDNDIQDVAGKVTSKSTIKYIYKKKTKLADIIIWQEPI